MIRIGQLGEKNIDLNDPNILNCSSFVLTKNNQEVIGTISMKIRATEITKLLTSNQENGRKFHTENTLITIQNANSSNNSFGNC